MKIFHHIGFPVIFAEEILAFRRIGIDLTGKKNLKIAESDPHWPAVQDLATRFRFPDIAVTEFTLDELNGSAYLGVRPDWHHGYPEPSLDRSYLSATFDLSDYCGTCGFGKRQTRPFRMRTEPKWGRREILQLNWIFDEYFVTPNAWRTVFAPFGVGSRPVLRNSNGHTLETVVQLEVVTQYELDLTDVPFDNCSVCRRKKYHGIQRGLYPASPTASGAAFRSSQYFGSGSSAYQLIFVANEVYRSALDFGLRGVNFKACRPANATDARSN